MINPNVEEKAVHPPGFAYLVIVCIPRLMLVRLAAWGIHGRTRWLRRMVVSTAYQKLLIIMGALRWHDLPHLHHPLIWLRVRWEEDVMARRVR